ncbi:hypothetical protein AMD24_00486 [Candidatus Xiphinematobacter sp. Idaho Grape]|nr:hypothetical protein AMD24_00486 [Candidatus Xiphinematobacter sp. Idaho Grape]
MCTYLADKMSEILKFTCTSPYGTSSLPPQCGCSEEGVVPWSLYALGEWIIVFSTEGLFAISQLDANN